MLVLALLLLLQLTCCACITSAIKGIIDANYSVDTAAATSTIPTSVPSIPPRFINLYFFILLLTYLFNKSFRSVNLSYPLSLSPHSISVISTIAGTGSTTYSGDNGEATSATINGPHGIDIDSSGNVYFSDFSNHRVRKIIVSTGIITTYAGIGSSSYSGDGGVASSAALNYPVGLCLDSSGNN